MAGKRVRDIVPSDIPSSLRGFIIDNIHLGNQIGRGANGRILEAKWEGTMVAVKEIHAIFINKVSDAEFQAFKGSFLRECEQSSRLCHPNIVRFFGIYWPTAARAPSLVMERLYCSLTSLLEQSSVFPMEIKVSIINDVALGLRYLHTRTPIIIHRDLSSNNVLVSKGMEGKIGDLGTVRLVDPTKQSRMTKAPGTIDFMPPEALAAIDNIRYERELDVFSFGCVMLHALSHQWPTPSEPVVTDPVTFELKAKSEIERRSRYFDKIPKSKSDVLIPVIKSCLNNVPKNRISIVTVCNQLEGLVSEQQSSTDDIYLPISALKQEIKERDAEILRKDAEINAEILKRESDIKNKNIQIQRQANEIRKLKSDMAKLQMQTCDLGQLETTAAAPARQYVQQKSQLVIAVQTSRPTPLATVAPPPTSDTQHTNTLKAKQPVVPTVLGATTTASASAANLVRTTDLAIQLEHMKNHFKQLQQHLMIGNQHLKELQKHPNQEQNIAQLQNKLKLGVQHYQQLQQAIQQTTKQLQQQKQLAPQPSAVQVIKSSSDFWNGLKLTWQQCSILPMKCNVTSIAELDGKVYVAISHRFYPLVYDSHKDEWSSLQKLPYVKCSLVAVHHSKQLLAIGGVLVLGDVISSKIFAWDVNDKKWTTPYPDMPIPCYRSSVISYGATVIVAGGVTCLSPWTISGVVEVLHITKHSSQFSKSYSAQWSVVEQLPHATRDAIPLIVDDHLYIAEGFDDDGESTCNIVTASLPELLQSGIKRTTSDKVWHKLPGMPYSPWSITHYQGRLIIFNGDRKVASSGKNKWELVKQSYLYNPSTNSWDYVGNDFHNYKLGRAVHLEKNKIIFMGGLTGTFNTGEENDLVKTCSMLTFTPK